MASYEYLNAIPPSAFLDANNFKTDSDTMPEKGYAEKQHAKGLSIGKEYGKVGVSCYGTWYAEKPGSCITSYEGIGYHSCTADLWRGFLDSGAEVWVHRLDGTETRIK